MVKILYPQIPFFLLLFDKVPEKIEFWCIVDKMITEITDVMTSSTNQFQ
jgi:hypothetical protein